MTKSSIIKNSSMSDSRKKGKKTSTNAKKKVKVVNKEKESKIVLSNDNGSDLRNNIIEQYKIAGDDNSLTTDDVFRLLDLYFYKEFYTYRHLHDSYDKFIDDTIPNFFKEVEHVFSEFITEEKYIKHKFEFTKIHMESPKLSNGVDPMFPADARHLATPYSMTIYADVTQIREVTNINMSGKDNVIRTVIGNTEKNKPIITVPVMIKSKYCNLNCYKEETHDECKYDPGGYFIVNGSEKVVICQDSMIRNNPMVFVKKNSNISYYVVQVNSKSPDPMGMMQAVSIKMKKDGVMIVKIPILYEVNVMTIFRALGIESDRDIINLCAYDQSDTHMVELLRASLDTCINDNDEREIKIQTQEEAIDYLITKMRVVKKYSESNQITKLEQKKLHLLELFKTSFLPHITKTSSIDPYREKTYYLGYMINKLLQIQLKRVPIDNRDSYCKKRVDNIRELFEEIMIQQYKNNMAECNKQFMARMGDSVESEEVYNVIHQFKAGTFEQGFKASLMLGNWPRKKGVSQMLQRFSYMQLLSFLSRIDSQSGTQSSSKLTKPRHVDPSSVPFLCVTGDTEVLLENGTTKRIDMMNNTDRIISFDIETMTLSKTGITNYFSKIANNLIELSSASGKIIKCTKDHPLLSYDGISLTMKNAGLINANDLIVFQCSNNDDLMNELKNGSTLLKDMLVTVMVASIKDIDSERVYDFTTISNTHTFIANGFIVSNCMVSTPEHAKIGLIKHLTMIGSITIGDRDNTALVKEFITLHPLIKKVYEVQIDDLKNMFKVFLNGEWLGVVENTYNIGSSYESNPILKFYVDAKVRKLTGAFNPQMTSIALDHRENEIRFNTDSGRLYRPVIRINGDNEMMLTKEMIDRISLKATDKGKITDWDEFYMQDPYPIEFIDSEEQPYMMIAEDRKTLIAERKKIIKSAEYKFTEDESKIVNRYDDKFFVRFDCVEIHPSVLLGEIATNIPFCNRNCAPRNIFQYAQGRQGMGIYCTSYRSRTDISYILYNPEVPIVNTRTSKYTYTDILPPGSNAVVAIACYSGYNQEDSLVFNKTSIDRGLFRSMSLRKYSASITKNQETSGDDKFMKPPQDKTLGIKNGQYDKMNEKGYIPEETIITNGDVIFGKVTPITDTTNSGKIFKDSSEQYKSHADGVIDRMYTGIKNQDGYETRKALIRSERTPLIGDKFCMKLDKTVEVLTFTGWKYLEEITKQDLVATLVNGCLHYDYPIDTYKFTYDGIMYKVRSIDIDFDVTIDHELYVKKKDQKQFELVMAKDVINTCYNLKKNCKNIYPDIKSIIINGTNYDYDAYLDFMGIFIACGSLYKSKESIIIAGLNKDFNKIITKLGMSFTEYNDQNSDHIYHLSNKDIYSKFEEITENCKSFLPEYVWDLSQRQARILLESLINSKDIEDYYTKSLVDDVMKLAIHCGYAGSVNEAGGINNYTIRIIKSNCEPEIDKDTKQQETYHYNGIVGCIEVPSHVFMIRQNNKNVWTGNCSRHGQKGTMGIGMDNIDMPFTKHGIRPDIIMNPNAIPSRMTIGQLWECLLGKIGALKGMNMDGTAFEDYDLGVMKNMLEKLGYQRECEEYLYNGMTGKMMKHMIFIGPTYYQRLKHMVQDKIHCLTKDHQVLTNIGWVQINNISKEHCVAIDIDSEISFQKPIEILQFGSTPRKIITIYYNDGTIMQQITEDHRVYVAEKNSDFKLIKVSELFNNDTFRLNCASMLSGLNNIINGPFEYKIDIKDEPVYCLTVKNERFITRYCKEGVTNDSDNSVWTGNSRARGPVTILTRNAPEGRSRDGGLRLGEMERDAVIAHGMAKFLKERLMDCADAYSTYVCGKCGMFARREDSRYNTSRPGPDDVYYCPMCNNYHDIHQIMIPYAFKLMLQELMAMNIAPRIRVQKHLIV